MNKADLIDAVAATSGETKATVKRVLDAQTIAVHEALANGDEVALDGLGKFKVAQRKGRTGRNPQTGKEIQIAAKKAPVFSAAKALKDAVNPS